MGWRISCSVSLLFIPVSFYFSCVQGNFKSKNVVDYYTSQHEIDKLARVEEEIAEVVENYIAVLEKRLEIAKRFKLDYDSSGITWGNALDVLSDKEQVAGSSGTSLVSTTSSLSAHPLRAFRLLRRFVTDLPRLEKELRADEERKFLKMTEKVKSKVSFPTQLDIKGATEGILRVHDTYNININDFTSGNFNGLMTNASINAADCFFIGLYALKSTILTRAIEWLEQAYQLVTKGYDNSISSKEVKEKLSEAITQHNNELSKRSNNPYLFTEPVSLDLIGKAKARIRLLDRDAHVLHNRESSLMDLTNFAALCGGKELRNQSEFNGLRCWYENRQPSNILHPLKVERHSIEPLVLQLHDLIPDGLLSNILKSAQDTLSRSQVYEKRQPDSKTTSATRTSTSTWLRDHKLSAIKSINQVYKKLEDYTGLKMSARLAEDLQVSCYGIAGHFNPHLDTIFTSVDKSSFDKEELTRGDRLATFMFYLSDVVRGGATAFPRIGVKVEPVKGSALFWYNMDKYGNPDPLTLHGGCPIIFGNKCISNKWIRYNYQPNVNSPS